MAITPPRRPLNADEFISGAPDAARVQPAVPVAAAPSNAPPATVAPVVSAAPAANQVARRRGGLKRGRREQISHTIDPELLEKVDRAARAMGQTRAGFINMAIFRAVQAETDKR